MKPVLEKSQERLMSIKKFATVDEDWGQLQEYGGQPPVKFPCALIDLSAATFSNTGINKQMKPMQRQEATGLIKFTFADQKLTNTSGNAPRLQKQKAWNIHDLIEEAHEVLHGFEPAVYSGALIRTAWKRVKRNDGIQQYEVTYSIGMHNV